LEVRDGGVVRKVGKLAECAAQEGEGRDGVKLWGWGWEWWVCERRLGE